MINSFRIVNFKAFEDQTIDLRPLTLFAGLNGMGKSSVLQSLLLLRQSHDRGLLQRGELDLNGELVALGTGQDILFEGATENNIGFELYSDEGLGDWLLSYNQRDDVLEGVDRSHSTVYDGSLFSDYFQYLQAERLGPRIFYEMSEYMVQQHKQIGSQGQFAAHFLSAFGANEVLPELRHPDSDSNTLSAQVVAWMNEISPGIKFDISQYTDMNIVRLGVAFERGSEIDTRFFNATNVGFGISYSLPILVAVLSASEDSLILLENPEAHLHPQGQSQLGNLLARTADTGAQVIVETHSDHILNGIRIAVRKRIAEARDIALHYFHRDIEDDKYKGVQISSPEIDKFGKLTFWPDGFFDEYGKNLDDLL